MFGKNARVRAAASTSDKVKGLTLAVREQYLTKLTTIFHTNYRECVPKDEQQFDVHDIEDCTVDVEYEIFTAKTTMTMYRSAIAQLVNIIYFFNYEINI